MAEALPIGELVFSNTPAAAQPGRRRWHVLGYAPKGREISLTSHASAQMCEAAWWREPPEAGIAWLIRPVATLPQRPLARRRQMQLRIQSVYNSAHMSHCHAFDRLIVPELERQGASVSSQYEVVIGPGRPTILVFIGWNSLEHMHDGSRATDASDAQMEKRSSELAAFGRGLEEKLEVLLLRESEANP